MSRNNQKARKRMNRQKKRHEEYLLNTCPDGNEEHLSRRNIYGNADLTAFYALYNIENPTRPRYGF